MAIGSFGLRPGQSVRRNEMWPSCNGVLQDKFANRSAWTSSRVLSTLAMHRLMVTELWDGATESARIRPSEGSSGSGATFDGIPQSFL